jgi:F420-dependent oxidoreductase-like protein
VRLGVVVANQRATVAGVEQELLRAEALGYDSAWMPGIPNGPDVLTLLAVAGRATSRIELGPAVLAVYARHPVAMASQALTTNDAVGGRLTLGLGASHERVVVDALGLDYRRPVRYLDEYLRILVPLLEHQHVDVRGEVLRTTYRLEASASGYAGPLVFLAALGPRMLELAGAVTTGAATWLVGPRTLEEVTVPTVAKAAAASGRPEPRVLVSLPFLLTDDPGAGRQVAAAEFDRYGRLPVYAAVLRQEGVERASELAHVGDERAITAAVGRLRDLGVTDLQLTAFGDPEQQARTLEFMATLR